MLNIQRRNHDALMRIRAMVFSQEHAMAEQVAQRKAFKFGGAHDDDHRMAMYQEEFKSSGGFGPDSKKRRGVCSKPGVLFTLTGTNHSNRKLPLLVDAIAATVPKRQNGAAAPMARGLCAMHAAYTTRS